jgi:hypothetical protein
VIEIFLVDLDVGENMMVNTLTKIWRVGKWEAWLIRNSNSEMGQLNSESYLHSGQIHGSRWQNENQKIRFALASPLLASKVGTIVY